MICLCRKLSLFSCQFLSVLGLLGLSPVFGRPCRLSIQSVRRPYLETYSTYSRKLWSDWFTQVNNLYHSLLVHAVENVCFRHRASLTLCPINHSVAQFSTSKMTRRSKRVLALLTCATIMTISTSESLIQDAYTFADEAQMHHRKIPSSWV